MTIVGGSPRTIKAFNEAIAILAGDALLTLAFEVASQPGMSTNGLAEEARLHVVRELAEGSGSIGMVGGQAADIESEVLPSTRITWSTSIHTKPANSSALPFAWEVSWVGPHPSSWTC